MYGCQPNVVMSCRHPEASARQRRARREGGCQLHYRVGLCLGPNLTSRSRKSRGKLRELTIRVVRLRCRQDPPGAVRRLRLFRRAGGHRERGGPEPLQPLAARRRPGRSRSSERRPLGAPFRTRNSPGFLAHDMPPWGRMVSRVCCRSTGVFKKVAPAGTALLGGGNRSDEEYSDRRTARASLATRGESRWPGKTALAEPPARRLRLPTTPGTGAARRRKTALAEPPARRPRLPTTPGSGAARTRNTALAEPLSRRHDWG